MNCMKLRGLVMSKYKTIIEFSKAIGWKQNKESRVLNGIQEPDIQDIEDLTRILEIDSLDTFLLVFLLYCPQCGRAGKGGDTSMRPKK